MKCATHPFPCEPRHGAGTVRPKNRSGFGAESRLKSVSFVPPSPPPPGNSLIA